ncbi:MAG: protoporphyrinogen oxidase [Acidobacteriota bacterium]|nr:protoporphyrinogen oxidase [Acidobacteriota bacterium]
MIAIAGGGISGLTAAYYLSKAGLPFTLFESRSRLGGVIETECVKGCAVEAGPDSFLASKPWAFELIGELGLADQVIGSNDSLRKTYIWKKGRLVPMPEGLQMIAPTRIGPLLRSPLFSAAAKFQMARELFRRPKDFPDRSVADFVGDHFGQESVEYLAEPLLAGVYGGDCGALSAPSVLPKFVAYEKKYGSITRGILAERKPEHEVTPVFQTLKGGMEQLTGALRGWLRVSPRGTIVHQKVETVERHSEGYRLRAGGDFTIVNKLLLACGAQDSGQILETLDPALAALLRSIPYTSATVVALGFARTEIRHPLNGFGFLVPRRERRSVMACTWVGTKFSHRVPPGLALLRCFIAGAPSPSDATVAAETLDDLKRIMGIHATPIFERVFRWPNSMAQYTVGHRERIREIEARLEGWPGLHLAGNGYHGIGIPDCVRLAKQCAERIATIGSC